MKNGTLVFAVLIGMFLSIGCGGGADVEIPDKKIPHPGVGPVRGSGPGGAPEPKMGPDG